MRRGEEQFQEENGKRMGRECEENVRSTGRREKRRGERRYKWSVPYCCASFSNIELRLSVFLLFFGSQTALINVSQYATDSENSQSLRGTPDFIWVLSWADLVHHSTPQIQRRPKLPPR